MLAALLLLGILPLAAMPVMNAAAWGNDPDAAEPEASDDQEEPAAPSVDEGTTYVIDPFPGKTTVTDFQPGLDSVEMDLTQQEGRVHFETATSPEGAILSVATDDTMFATVEFTGLEQVPAGDVFLTVNDEATGGTYELPLSDALYDPEASVLEPTDPDAPDEPAPISENDSSIEPTDPDAPDPPGPKTVDDPVLQPLDPDDDIHRTDPEVPGQDVIIGAAPVIIPGFQLGEDFLNVTLSSHANQDAAPLLEVGASEDGVDGVVRLDGNVLAILQGAPQATLADVNADIRSGPL